MKYELMDIKQKMISATSFTEYSKKTELNFAYCSI